MDDVVTVQPWLDDDRWRDGRARSSALAELFPWWFATVCAAGILAPLLFTGFEPVTKEGPLATGAVGLLGLAAGWLFVQAIRATLAWRRFGRLEIVLDPFPGSIGGQMGGAIDVALPRLEARRARIILSCVEVKVTEHGKNRSRSESVIWSQEQHPVVEPGPRGVRLRFTFDVPDGVPQTQPRSAHHHLWTVRVMASVPGLDLDRAIEVPVYRTDTPLEAATAAPQSPTHAPTSAATDGAVGPGVTVNRTSDGLAIAYAAKRARAAAMMVLLFGIVFGGFALGMLAAGSRYLTADGLMPGLAWPMLVLFVAIFGGIGLLLSMTGLWMLGNSLRVQMGAHTFTTVRRFLGVPCKRRTIPIADVARIDLVINGQTGQGAKAEVSYRMDGVLHAGGTVRLGDGIRGTPVAERIAALVEQATGLSPKIVVRESLRKRRERSAA